MIRGWSGRTEWGLHLTLTDAAPMGPMPRLAPQGRLPPLSGLLARAVTVGLPRGEVRDEIARQVDAFESVTGRPPAFVDGHQHVHILPGVRDAVLALFCSRLDPARTWLRVCTSSPWDIVQRGVARRRALLIDRLSRPLERRVRQLGLLTNADFRGVTDFRTEGVAAEFDKWLQVAGPRTLLMCHPGRVDDALQRRDRVLERREIEHAYLAGGQFEEALNRHGLSLAPLAPRPQPTREPKSTDT